MKKFITTVLALALALSMSVSAFAAETNTGGDTTINVKARYAGSSTTVDVVSVDIEWGAMQFTYSESGSRTWNPANHSYTTSAEAGWSASGNTVTVTNHSNVDVTVGFGYEADTVTTATGSFDITSKTLTAGVEGKYAEADSVTAALTLTGTVPSTQTEFAKVGTVTVSIDT